MSLGITTQVDVLSNIYFREIEVFADKSGTSIENKRGKKYNTYLLPSLKKYKATLSSDPTTTTTQSNSKLDTLNKSRFVIRHGIIHIKNNNKYPAHHYIYIFQEIKGKFCLRFISYERTYLGALAGNIDFIYFSDQPFEIEYTLTKQEQEKYYYMTITESNDSIFNKTLVKDAALLAAKFIKTFLISLEDLNDIDKKNTNASDFITYKYNDDPIIVFDNGIEKEADLITKGRPIKRGNTLSLFIYTIYIKGVDQNKGTNWNLTTNLDVKGYVNKWVKELRTFQIYNYVKIDTGLTSPKYVTCYMKLCNSNELPGEVFGGKRKTQRKKSNQKRKTQRRKRTRQ